MATIIPSQPAAGSVDSKSNVAVTTAVALDDVPQVSRDRLKTGEVLLENQPLTSPNGRFRLIVETGCINLYDGENKIWTSKTRSQDPCKLIMQDDDVLFLVQQRVKGYHMWTSGTRNRANGGSAVLILRDSGAAVVETEGIVIWATDSSLIQPYNPKFTLCPADSTQLGWGQYLPLGQAITSANGEYSVFLREDGAMCLRRNTSNVVIWSKGKNSGTNASRLVVTYDCRLAVYASDGSVMWSHGGKLSVKYTTELKVRDDANIEMERSHRESGGMTQLFRAGYTLPMTKEPLAALESEQAITIDQKLTSGDYEMGFNTYGNVFIRNIKENRIVYYYTSIRIWEGAVVLQVTRDGLIEFFDETGTCRGRSRNNHGYDWWKFPPTKLSLSGDGQLTLQNLGNNVWTSKTEILQGSEPKMPSGMCLGTTLVAGQTLLPGQILSSSNGDFYFINQPDGNLVVKHKNEEKPRWIAYHMSDSKPEPGKLTLYESGLLAKYGRDDKTEKWSNRETRGGGDVKMVLQSDGNFLLLIDDVRFWATQEKDEN